MDNLIRNTTEYALHIVNAYMPESDREFTVIDGTCGNGHDTLALAKMLWPSGYLEGSSFKLYGFDIQKDAIDNTFDNLCQGGFGQALESGSIKLVHDSHENIKMHLPGGGMHSYNVDIAVFNLGYLPGGNKEITTNVSSTLDAIASLLEILNKDGLISITMYSGHEAGAKEKAELLAFAQKLDSRIYHVSYISMINQQKNPPEILLITKKK